MEIDGGWEPCPLDDPEPLRRALTLVSGTNADAVCQVQPVTQPTVERKGLLGRVKQVPADYALAVIHWSDETGAGEFELSFVLPPGPPFEQRVGLPAGVAHSAPDGTTATMTLAEHHSPASAAATILGLLPTAYAGFVTGPWQVQVYDNSATVGD